jgi:hypothetical protein
MWNPFKKRGKGVDASEPQVRPERPNTVDATADDLQQEGRFGEVEQEPGVRPEPHVPVHDISGRTPFRRHASPNEQTAGPARQPPH